MSSSSNGRHASGKALDLADAISAAERRRQAEARLQRTPWWRWGPYLSERQWGTVREDYSPGGTAWEWFTHEHARSRTYRWGEDGLLGITDNHGRLCFSLALWNEADPILKERLFGLTGPEGNHGEDVKEYYFYLDSTPTAKNPVPACPLSRQTPDVLGVRVPQDIAILFLLNRYPVCLRYLFSASSNCDLYFLTRAKSASLRLGPSDFWTAASDFCPLSICSWYIFRMLL